MTAATERRGPSAATPISGHDQTSLLRALLALVAPLVTLVVQGLLWPMLEPHAWFLFYPTLFVSAWIGGRDAGIVATTLSIALVWWFFLPSETTRAPDARTLFESGVFLATGVALSWFHGRLTRSVAALASKTQLEADLRRMTDLHGQLTGALQERRVFAALVENSRDFIGIADADGRALYVSPAGRRMVGLSADQPVTGVHAADFSAPEQRAFARDVILPTLASTGEWQGETYLRHWQTEEGIPVSARHFLIQDPETGAPLGMGTIMRDIRDEKRLERELVEARDFLTNVLESSTEYSIIAKDLERRIVGWNAGARRNYGYEASEVIGRSSDVLHVPEELRSGAVAELHQRALDEGHASGLFHRRRKDGSEFLARVVITRRNDARGRAVGYLVVSHDVTVEQRHVEEQQFLAQLGEALQTSLDPTAIAEHVAEQVVGFLADACAIDLVRDDGTLERASVVLADRARTARGERGALEGERRPVRKVLEPKQPIVVRGASSEPARSPLDDSPLDDEDRRMLDALGARSAILAPLVARDRRIGVLTIASARPEGCGTELLPLVEELARRASLALDNARLYEVAQDAIRTRDRVLGVVAHDLRNPLNTVHMQASLLRSTGAGGPTSSRSAETIERAAKRMNRLIQDLLDVTRMEAGRLVLERARVSPRQLVDESVEAHRALAAAAGLELGAEVADDVPEIEADRDRLLQVLENLVGNAIKFTAPGGRITVAAAARGDEVLFAVRDTGPGIAAEDLPHVFDRFWQADATARRGTGLGLAIVKGIVEAHGGRVWVESTLGQGTTMLFAIPAAPRAA